MKRHEWVFDAFGTEVRYCYQITKYGETYDLFEVKIEWGKASRSISYPSMLNMTALDVLCSDLRGLCLGLFE